MTNLEDLTKKYLPYSLYTREDYPYPRFRPLMAMRYIADCIEAGHQFLGISGFYYYKGEGIQPEQDFEVDLEDFEDKQAFYAKVGKIIMGNIGKEVLFEICFEPKAD